MPGGYTEVVPRNSGGREFCSYVYFTHQTGEQYQAYGITPNGVSNFTGVLEDFDFFVDPVYTGEAVDLFQVRGVIQVINTTDSSVFETLFSFIFVVGGDNKPQWVTSRYPINFRVPEGYILVVSFDNASRGPFFIGGANFRWRSSNIVIQ